jgi:hypothetical protein
MTGDNNDENDVPKHASARLISVVDAVCCVYFCAAGKSSLLLRVLVTLGMEILVPAEVEREVLAKRIGQVRDQWPRLRSSARVKILKQSYLSWRRSQHVPASTGQPRLGADGRS